MFRIINTNRLADNKGSLLVFSVVLSIATIALGTAFLMHVDYNRRQISWDIAETQAVMAAHAAQVRGRIVHSESVHEYDEPFQEFYAGDGYSVEYRYSAGLEELYNAGYGQTKDFAITGFGKVVTNEYDYEFEYSTQRNRSSQSYANWLYITDKETQQYRPLGSDTIKFWGPDTLDGKVHSNDMISFQFGEGFWPTFEKKVTSCSSRWNPFNAEDDVNFHGGFALNYTYFPFPITADSVRKYNWYANPNLGVPYEQQGSKITEIVLQPNYFIVRHRIIQAGSRNRTTFPVDGSAHSYVDPAAQLLDIDFEGSAYRYEYPPNGALFIEGELWLVGARNSNHFNSGSGKPEDAYMCYGFDDYLTIGASGDIIIAQDVMYKDFIPGPDSMPSATTAALGLISEKHILVWRNAPNYIRVTAGLGAIGYGITEDRTLGRWDTRCWNNAGLIPLNGTNGTISIDGINCFGWDNPKIELLIYGCLIMRERGLVHTTYNEGAPFSERGYDSKAYRYDNRFVKNPPPHFFEMRGLESFYREPIYIYWEGGYE